MRRATDAERERLHDTFAALCRIDSPSGHERPCADWVSAELRRIGQHIRSIAAIHDVLTQDLKDVGSAEMLDVQAALEKMNVMAGR